MAVCGNGGPGRVATPAACLLRGRGRGVESRKTCSPGFSTSSRSHSGPSCSKSSSTYRSSRTSSRRDGIPIHGFGVMLFITFILGVWFLGWQSRRNRARTAPGPEPGLGHRPVRVRAVGARITYMIQYGDTGQAVLPNLGRRDRPVRRDHLPASCAYLAFFYLVLRRAGVSFWKLADVVGPGLALCIALGRIGCFLNGCCYGHVAAEGCPSVGFPAADLPGPRRGQSITRRLPDADRLPGPDRVGRAEPAQRRGPSSRPDVITGVGRQGGQRPKRGVGGRDAIRRRTRPGCSPATGSSE